MSITAMKLALEAMDAYSWEQVDSARAALRTAIEQAEKQEPVYDKTALNAFVQDLYDAKMREGKHGHYETLFHCVHQAIKRVAPPAAQRQWVGLDAGGWFEWWRTAKLLEHTQAEIDFPDFLMIALAVQDVLGKKNGGQE